MLDRHVHRRLAIVLYGPLRTAEETAASLFRHVVADRDATLFYYGPAQTDAPGIAYGGTLDMFGTFKRNPKAQVSTTVAVHQDALRVYGERLGAFELHHRSQSEFIAKADAAIDRADWLMQLNPYRMFAMFANIEGSIRLMLVHEAATGQRFDDVVITRPDLAFYSSIRTRSVPGQVHVPGGEGLNPVGQPHRGNARTFFYKNVSTGDFVAGGDLTFNDQFFLINRADIAPFLELTEALPKYLKARVPPSPETILYLHLAGRAGLKPIQHPEWTYEIHRNGAPLIRNVADTPEINMVDRRHPAAVAFRRRRPAYSALRDIRWLVRRVVLRLFH